MSRPSFKISPQDWASQFKGSPLDGVIGFYIWFPESSTEFKISPRGGASPFETNLLNRSTLGRVFIYHSLGSTSHKPILATPNLKLGGIIGFYTRSLESSTKFKILPRGGASPFEINFLNRSTLGGVFVYHRMG
jgi:hypothetical protein